MPSSVRHLWLTGCRKRSSASNRICFFNEYCHFLLIRTRTHMPKKMPFLNENARNLHLKWRCALKFSTEVKLSLQPSLASLLAPLLGLSLSLSLASPYTTTTTCVSSFEKYPSWQLGSLGLVAKSSLMLTLTLLFIDATPAPKPNK